MSSGDMYSVDNVKGLPVDGPEAVAAEAVAPESAAPSPMPQLPPFEPDYQYYKRGDVDTILLDQYTLKNSEKEAVEDGLNSMRAEFAAETAALNQLKKDEQATKAATAQLDIIYKRAATNYDRLKAISNTKATRVLEFTEEDVKIKTATTQLESLREAETAARTDYNEKQSKYNIARFEYAQKDMDLKQLERTLVRLDTDTKRLEDLETAKKQKEDAYTRALTTLKDDTDEITDISENKMAPAVEELRSATEAHDALVELKNRGAEGNADLLSSYEDDIVELSSRKEAAQKAVDDLTNRKAALEDEVAATEVESETLKDQIHELAERITILSDTIKATYKDDRNSMVVAIAAQKPAVQTAFVEQETANTEKVAADAGLLAATAARKAAEAALTAAIRNAAITYKNAGTVEGESAAAAAAAALADTEKSTAEANLKNSEVKLAAIMEDRKNAEMRVGNLEKDILNAKAQLLEKYNEVAAVRLGLEKNLSEVRQKKEIALLEKQGLLEKEAGRLAQERVLFQQREAEGLQKLKDMTAAYSATAQREEEALNKRLQDIQLAAAAANAEAKAEFERKRKAAANADFARMEQYVTAREDRIRKEEDVKKEKYRGEVEASLVSKRTDVLKAQIEEIRASIREIQNAKAEFIALKNAASTNVDGLNKSEKERYDKLSGLIYSISTDMKGIREGLGGADMKAPTALELDAMTIGTEEAGKAVSDEEFQRDMAYAERQSKKRALGQGKSAAELARMPA